MTSTKHTILQLPLVPPEERLTLNLLPDPVIPEAKSLIATSHSSPSLVRRARPVLQGAHFSYLTPFTLSFPYEFPDEQDSGESMGERHQREQEELERERNELTPDERAAKQEERHKKRMEEIEAMMRRYDIQPAGVSQPSSAPLDAFVPPGRQAQHFPSARLLSFSPSVLRDCLPHLDVGDAAEWIKSQNGKGGPHSYSSGPMAVQPATDSEKARIELSDFLSGRLIGAKLGPSLDPSKALEDDLKIGIGNEYLEIKAKTLAGELKQEEMPERVARRLEELDARIKRGDAAGYAPWSLCYAGHQFGQWAGQLGDGRAITLLETKNPETGERWEIQLKGAGRTPYSRFADGLAVLASSVREYLASEAVAALGIPTSRALAVISLPDLSVFRERMNPAAVTTRLNPSWLRIGSFQIHSSRSEWESVRILGEYVARDLFKWFDVVKGNAPGERKPWARRLVEEVARRNAKTIALWQVYGFMHGVMNTDNIALLGQTIDYGPYAFMDIFDEGQICNHSDGEGRYAYRLQPTMGVFAIRELINALAPLLGFEARHGRAPAPGELVAFSSTELEELTEQGLSEYGEAIEVLFTSTLLEHWKTGWRSRLGLSTSHPDDKSKLIDPLASVLTDLDFTNTLRGLARFPAALKARGASNHEEVKEVARSFVDEWYDASVLPDYARDPKREQARAWLVDYGNRLVEQGRDGDEVAQEMKKTNPSFTLRNWITTEVVKRLEDGNDTDFLDKVLQMCINPFEDWGLPAAGKDEAEVKEEARLCSVGQPLVGNLPSCSS